MCGIVGLFIKDKGLEPQLGQLLSGMLATMCDRGPDSAGFAIYGGGEAGLAKITVQSPNPAAFNGLDSALGAALGTRVSMTTKDTHAVLRLDGGLIGEA
jgi:asparagine synthetase B (glutamine-hydrolysing)